MAANRKVFAEAMRAGADAAWDGSWEGAIAAYQRALAEFPDDISALTAIGLAQFSAGYPESALGSYQRASALAPDDPVLLERIGEALEELGQTEAAASSYANSAERYLSQRGAAHVAVQRWQDAIRIHPEHEQSHVRLLRFFQRRGEVREAVGECLALAHIYQGRGQSEYATRICHHALKLAPHDPEVLDALDALHVGGQVATQEGAEGVKSEGPAMPGVGRSKNAAVSGFPDVSDIKAAEREGSPVEVTRLKALTELAESVFEEEDERVGRALTTAPTRLSKAETDALIGQAVDYQTRGRTDAAIAAYEQVSEAGAARPAVHFNLGLLFQEKLRFDDAILQFNHAVSDPKYMLGARFALGECYRAKGQIYKAVEQFIEVLKTVDLAAVGRDRAGDLVQLYDSLANSSVVKGNPAQAMALTSSLVEFLSEKGWEAKVAQARERLDTLAQDGPSITLAEMLTIPDSEHVLASISLAQEYLNQGMPYSALEECYYALQRAPEYLPTHRQLTQILFSIGQVAEAMAKFVAIADLYQVRGDAHQAQAMYERALEMAPMDAEVRTKLIDLLVGRGHIDEALEHYLILADNNYHLAQMDKAREVYEEALRLAPMGDPQQHWQVRILHKVGDIDMQRVNWKEATSIYEQIRNLDATDERARLTLMDLYYRFDRPDLAISELDGLLEIYREQGNMKRIFAILEEAILERKDDIPLRTRLAQLYLNAGLAEQALEHLDTLGDLQLSAGRIKDAKATLRAIIALKPPDVAGYQQQLHQLG